MIAQLIDGVTHDFNDFLMLVLGNLDLLRERALPDVKLTRLIYATYLGAQRGTALVQHLLAFAHKHNLKLEP
jgi:signal transduction histidine kinase